MRVVATESVKAVRVIVTVRSEAARVVVTESFVSCVSWDICERWVTKICILLYYKRSIKV